MTANLVWAGLRCFGAIAGLGVIALSSGASAASCNARVIGVWQVTITSTGQTYPTTVSPGGTLQSHCPGCAPQTWSCAGSTFTVRGPGSVVIDHAVSADGRRMTSAVSILVRAGGAAERKQEPKNPCSPTARAVSQEEGSGSLRSSYEALVVDNDCDYPVRFQYTIETRGVGSKTHWSNCVPASRTGFVATRTSSTSMASLSASANYRACR